MTKKLSTKTNSSSETIPNVTNKEETSSKPRAKLSSMQCKEAVRSASEPYLSYGERAPQTADAAVREESEPLVMFFGNGPLADATLKVLKEHTNIIFHARTMADLEKVTKIKQAHPDAHGILASFGLLIKQNLLQLFEPEGILNLHPSKLPLYRGASPIESAILNGDTDFSYSIMKLVKAMDAGPIYHQATLHDLPFDKAIIYDKLATAGAEWLVQNLNHLPQPVLQDNNQATYTEKLNKGMSFLKPESAPATEIYRQIVAYQGFPKPKYRFYDKTCIILKAHVLRVTDILCEAAGINGTASSPLMLKCADRNFVVIDELQPEGKKPMDAVSFMNGYGKPKKS